MENKQKKNETFNIKLNLLKEKIDIKITSDYKDFISNICNILLISQDQFNSLLFSYIDEDGDSITISTEEDYMIFVQQIKEKFVNDLYIEFKQDSNIDQNICLGNALDYQEQIEKENNNIIKNNNKINNNFNDNYINNNMNNNKINYDVNNGILDKEPENIVPVDDKLFYFDCHYCNTFPIVCTLYYCDKCQIHICEDCWKKIKHEHKFQKFESNNEFLKIKDKENKEIEKKKQIKNNQNNNQLNHNYNNNNYMNNGLNNNNYMNNDLNNNNYINIGLNNNNYRNNDLNNNNYLNIKNIPNIGITIIPNETYSSTYDFLSNSVKILKKNIEEDFQNFKDMVKNQMNLKTDDIKKINVFIKTEGDKDKQ